MSHSPSSSTASCATKTSLSTGNGWLRTVAHWTGLGGDGGNEIGEKELDKVVKSMQEHLMQKNVAAEIAIELCASVAKALIGRHRGTFESS